MMKPVHSVVTLHATPVTMQSSALRERCWVNAATGSGARAMARNWSERPRAMAPMLTPRVLLISGVRTVSA